MFFKEWLGESNGDVWYHGSSNQFESFKMGKYQPDTQLGFGIHFAKDRDFAKLYGNFIYECRLTPQKVLDQTAIHSVEDEETYSFAKELYKKSRRARLIVSGGQFVLTLDVVRPQTAVKLLEKYEYDGVLYEAKYGSLAMSGMQSGISVSNKSISMTMINPSKIEILNVVAEP